MYYDYYEYIKKLVLLERLLVYRVGKDGWEFLCKFFDKRVLVIGFLWVNMKFE